MTELRVIYVSRASTYHVLYIFISKQPNQESLPTYSNILLHIIIFHQLLCSNQLFIGYYARESSTTNAGLFAALNIRISTSHYIY